MKKISFISIFSLILLLSFGRVAVGATLDLYNATLTEGGGPVSTLAKTSLIAIKTITATGDVNRAFIDKKNQCADITLFEICRVRSLDDRPVMVEEIYCRTAQFDNLENKALEGSITKIFSQNYDVKISRESSRIFVTALPADKAAQLQLNSGASCLKIYRQRFSEDNELIDYNIEYWVHGAIEINVTSD